MPTTPIVTLVSNGVQVLVSVEDGDLADVRVGGPARLTVTAFPGGGKVKVLEGYQEVKL